MKIARVLRDNEPRIIIDAGAGPRLAPADVPDDIVVAVELARDGATQHWPAYAPGSDRVLAPIAKPGKIIAVGLNYADHTTETGFTPPERPLTFAKYSSSLAGPADDIIVPGHLVQQPDYEAELALVIGRRCGGATIATVDDVLGYTVANDVSARDVQFSDGQWTRAKSFDTFTPLGPHIVTADEFGDPSGRRIWTSIGDELLQDDSTSSMVFDVAALLAWISAATTLEPGDVILTGTPAGAGGFRTPPRFLRDGDVVEVGVEGIGELVNRVVIRTEAAA